MGLITFRAIQDSLTTVFNVAAHERGLRSGFLVNPGTGQEEPEWVVFERRCMWFAVNVWRQTLGLPPVMLSDIERLETLAQGHADYASKLVFYCSELVLRRGSSTT